MTLSYAEARRALDAAIAKAEELGATLGIAVVDARGFPVAVGRMDGVPPVAPDIAVGRHAPRRCSARPAARSRRRCRRRSRVAPRSRRAGGS